MEGGVSALFFFIVYSQDKVLVLGRSVAYSLLSWWASIRNRDGYLLALGFLDFQGR
jgi:hypothetical protein